MLNQKNYEDKVYAVGRVSTVIFALATLMLPVMLWLKWGLLPTKAGFIAGLSIIASILIPISIGEFLSYAPIIGSAGYFVMLLSGNWMNIRVPASIVALEATELDPNSEEGDVVSTMAIATSTIVTEIIIVVGVVLLAPFTSFFAQPAIKVGFEQIVPALFGALFISTLIKNWKAIIVPTIVGFAVIKFGLVNPMYNIPTIIFVSVILTIILFKLGIYTKKSTVSNDEAAN
jgi:hypothetical protein